MTEVTNQKNAHWARYKKYYIAGGILLATTIAIAATYKAGQKNFIGTLTSKQGNNALNVDNGAKTLIGNPTITNNLTQVVQSFRQGAPSWVVRCLETGEAFMSQSAAAKAMDISATNISRHLNGLLDNAQGCHFERICMAA